MSRRASEPRRRPDGLRVVAGSAPAPLAEDHPAHWGRPRTRTVAIASGKGGVGKSQLAANLAVALGQRGARVLLVDADFSQANLDLLLGVHPRFDIQHVFAGEKTLEDIVVAGPTGVTLVPAASGVPEFTELDDIRFETLLRGIGQLGADHDLVLLDTASGASRLLTSFCLAADDVVVVTTPDLPSFSDAYGLIKALHGQGLERAPHLLLSMSASPEETEETTHRMRLVARRFLRLDLDTWGPVPFDASIALATRRQEPCVLAFPNGPAAAAYRDIAARLWSPEAPDPAVPNSTPHRLEA